MQSWIFNIIVTWSFRNQYADYFLLLSMLEKQLFKVFVETDTFFQDSLMNKNFSN